MCEVKVCVCVWSLNLVCVVCNQSDSCLHWLSKVCCVRKLRLGMLSLCTLLSLLLLYLEMVTCPKLCPVLTEVMDKTRQTDVSVGDSDGLRLRL